MKTSRSLLVWATLALCGVMVLAAMTWLTRGVLASEKERTVAESRADLEERTRLALWRMDAVGAAIVLGENRHPPADYESNAAFPATTDPAVRLHFQLRQLGKLTSPEGSERKEHFENLRKLLNTNPLPGDEWSTLTCAAEAGENAWQAVPKEALKSQSDNAVIRQQKGGQEVRNDIQYQNNFNGTERAQRAKSVGEALNNSSQTLDQKQVFEISPAVEIAELGTMRSIWVGGNLFLLRQLTAAIPGSVEKRVQGVWLDHEALKQRLLAEVKDLLPTAVLTPIMSSAADDPLALVSFPFHLQRNEVPPTAVSTLNGPLLVGWGAVLLALLTASLLVHAIMRLSERRASFVSAVTHELRTPLTTFRLYSDMLESGAVREEKRGDYLRVLSREADRLSHLVENVLAFSKIERGSARATVRELRVADLLAPMRERLEARLATASLTLEMDLETPGAAKIVRVDSAAVEHILFNLIDNAAKYAAAGDPPLVKISIEATPREVEIIVSDHGPGIPFSEHRRVFRAFHKSAREAAESRPGVGLGLALSRRLAKSLGGALDCAASDHGARFILRIPLAGI
ncbi:MAG: HAMP domain-containing sensor histidine kinase [Luteolibacter sp.]